MGWSETHKSLKFQWYMTFTPYLLKFNFPRFFLSVYILVTPTFTTHTEQRDHKKQGLKEPRKQF